MDGTRITDVTHTGIGWGLDEATSAAIVAPFSLPGDIIIPHSPNKRSPESTFPYTIIEPSPFRRNPPCSAFPACSGCSFMHADPTWQIRFKEQQVRALLSGSADLAQWYEPLQSSTERYRRKARLRSRWDAKSNTQFIGFKNRFGRFIADIEQCEVLAPPFNTLIRPLRELLSSLDSRSAIPQLELAVGDNGAAIIVRHLSPLTEQDTERLSSFATIHDIVLFLQSGGPDSIAQIGPDPAKTLSVTLPSFNLSFEFSPLDFIQAHGSLNELLVSSAIDWLNPQPHEVILDLFCGLGNFSLPIAQRAAKVVGIEGSSSMTQRAEANAIRNGIKNVTFFASDLEHPIVLQRWTQQKYDGILLDPPRSGAGTIIPALSKMGPSRVVYVSCNPKTFAADTRSFAQFGYHLTRVRVADMFPHTEHVETIGLFERF